MLTSTKKIQIKRPVAYRIITLIKGEINYNTIEKMLLGIVWSVKHFHPYLYGMEFERKGISGKEKAKAENRIRQESEDEVCAIRG